MRIGLLCLLVTLVQAHTSNYHECNFWIGEDWFDLKNLTLKAPLYYTGADRTKSTRHIDFNFCKSLEKADSTCSGDYYAAHWDEKLPGECVALSGSTDKEYYEQSIVVDSIPDRDENTIGIELK